MALLLNSLYVTTPEAYLRLEGETVCVMVKPSQKTAQGALRINRRGLNEADGAWDLQPRVQQNPLHPFGDVNTIK